LLALKVNEMSICINSIDTPSVLTKTNLPVGDYSANPYIGCTHGCKYCYASFMKRFTNHSEPWGEFLDVKFWPQIEKPQKYNNKDVFLCSVTDPYLPEEKEFRRTRALLQQLQGSEVKLSIQTKSDLVLRDLDIIKSMPNARVGFSINTLDEAFRNDMDKAVSIERRLDAMKILHDEHIRTICFISPIFPGITDVQAIINRVKDQCNLIWLENLNLRGSYKPVILQYIHDRYPQLTGLYDEIYLHGSRMYWELLDESIRNYAKENGMEYVVDDDSMKKPFDAPPVIVNFFYHEEIKKNARNIRVKQSND
jgi:radical SAM mobile pair protein B